MLPRSATDHDLTQERYTEVAVRAAARIWRRMPRRGNWERAWREDVGPDVQAVVLAAQEASAVSADAYIASVLAELDIPTAVNTSVNIDALVGVAGDGRPVDSLTYGAVIQAAKAQYLPEVASLPSDQATALSLDRGSRWLTTTIAGVLADTTRAAESASAAQRPWVTGYVRMVSPGACSRCIVLAGKFYLGNTGFQRHTACKCRHIPASENVAGDMTTNPDAYFRGLSRAQQDETFTPAGAEAIRLGADMNQVVNARRGMQVAQVYGRKVLVTTEATTARGLAGKSLGSLGKVAGERYRRSQVPRIMPETILANATSPEDALRLLQRFGYVL